MSCQKSCTKQLEPPISTLIHQPGGQLSAKDYLILTQKAQCPKTCQGYESLHHQGQHPQRNPHLKQGKRS
jgi:hypothetical protein